MQKKRAGSDWTTRKQAMLVGRRYVTRSDMQRLLRNSPRKLVFFQKKYFPKNYFLALRLATTAEKARRFAELRKSYRSWLQGSKAIRGS